MQEILLKILMAILTTPGIFTDAEAIFEALKSHDPEGTKVQEISDNLSAIGNGLAKSIAIRNGANGS